MQTAVFTLPLLETVKRIMKKTSLNARKPGTVLSRLITQHLVSAVFLTVLDVYFVVFYDSRIMLAF